MAIQKIEYANKEALVDDPSIAEKNKVTDDNMNEIKSVVNNNADELGNLDLTYQTKSNLTTTINAESTDEQYPSAKAIYDEISDIKDNIDDLDNQIETIESDLYENVSKSATTGTITLTQIVENRDLTIPKVYGESTQETTNGYQLLNLVNGTSSSNGVTVTISNGEMALNGTATANAIIAFDFSYTFLANTNYTISANNNIAETNAYDVMLRFDDNVKPFNLNTVNKTNTISFTENTSVLKFTLRVANGVNTDGFVLKPMIEVGSVAHSWEKYTGGIQSPNPSFPSNFTNVTGSNTVTIANSDNTQSQTKTLNLGSIQLRGIGDYQDYIYKNNGKWYVKKKIADYTLGDISSISTGTLFNVSCSYVIYRNLTNVNSSTTTKTYPFLCNKVSPSNEVANLYSGYVISTNLVVIVDSNDTVTTVNQKLSGANVIYQLTSSAWTDTEITDSTLISQLEVLQNLKLYANTTVVTIDDIKRFDVLYDGNKIEVLEETANNALPASKIQVVTQAQYDALVSGGTVDSTVYYLIEEA